MASLGLPGERDNLCGTFVANCASRSWPMGNAVVPPRGKATANSRYSRASASTGSSRAAERAGMKPKITPIRLAEAMASTIDSGE